MCKEGILKHKVVFDAWLNGADIQYRDKGVDEEWYNIKNPSWSLCAEYRVKPVVIVTAPYRRYVYNNSLAYTGTENINYVHSYTKGKGIPESELEKNPGFIKWLDDDWITEEFTI